MIVAEEKVAEMLAGNPETERVAGPEKLFELFKVIVLVAEELATKERP